MEVIVKILDQPELMKCSGLRSSEVKTCYKLTGNDFGRLQWDLAFGKVEWGVGLGVGWLGGLGWVVFARNKDWQSQSMFTELTGNDLVRLWWDLAVRKVRWWVGKGGWVRLGLDGVGWLVLTIIKNWQSQSINGPHGIHDNNIIFCLEVEYWIQAWLLKLKKSCRIF